MIGSLGMLAGAAALGQSTGKPQSAADPNVNFGLTGKSAIVTGAARGIGRSICVALAKAGADVMGIDIAATVSTVVPYPAATPTDLKETARLVKAENRKFVTVTADIRDSAAMKAAADSAVKEFGKIDILVCDAAIQCYSPVAEMTDAQWKDVIDVNVNGTFNTIRAVVNQMIAQKNGRIVLIASGQGRHGFKNGSSYAASKWAVLGLMKSLALELAEYNITVNSVEPGLIDTAMTRNAGRWNLALKAGGKEAEGDHPNEQDVIAARMIVAVQKVPWMQPDEVAPPVVFLCSDAAFRITGASFDVTAGDSANYTA
jgi:NAD(P)-dependent dehydrogenase (short-subunit alcohol dehydrogenase family)